MSGCQDCAAATKGDHWGFADGCSGCCARAASRSPHFRRVTKDGYHDRAYRSLLDQFGLSHEQVRAAAAVDRVEASR